MKIVLFVFVIALCCYVRLSESRGHRHLHPNHHHDEFENMNSHHDGHRHHEHYMKRPKAHSIKIVNYAFKNEYGMYETMEMPVRDLQIAPFDKWAAKAIWVKDDYNKTGWSFLEIETNEQLPDTDQAFAAGLLEGKLTQELISLHLLNTVGDFCAKESEQCSKVIEFLTTNFKWMKTQIDRNPNDAYWHQVNLLFSQFNGLFHGYYGLESEYYATYHHVLDKMIDDIKPYLNLLALQLNGDMGELMASLNGVSDPFMAGSCSALIKVLTNNSDLYVAHDTWGPYEVMLKMLKHFKLHYHISNIDRTIIPGSEISFSSYPGILSSIDDFYVIKSGLVVLETTIGNSNADLWKYVTTDTNLYWIRNLVANRLSHNGTDWAKCFSLFNSGTFLSYNNEWMVVDYKKFTPGQPLQDGLFTVLEQLPGQVVWTDKTDVLRKQNYWPSYNLAYYPEVYNISGTYDAFLKYGSFFSYDESSRANIFRRDQSSVVDIASMISMMRYANFTLDPLSKCDGCSPAGYSGENTISARSDLNAADGKYPFDALGHRDHGATDMKLTNFKMSHSLEFIGISGPTYGYPGVGPFVWSDADFGNSTNHFGHPDEWTFPPVHVKWQI